MLVEDLVNMLRKYPQKAEIGIRQNNESETDINRIISKPILPEGCKIFLAE